MTYFPRIGNEESIKFSYFSRIKIEAIKRMVAGESCCGEWVVSDRRAGGLMIFLGVSDVRTTEILMGEGQGWLMGIAVKDVQMGWWGY